jgi:uncharacterized protein
MAGSREPDPSRKSANRGWRSRASRAAIQADPELVRTRARPLLLDVWQKVPEVWDAVRRVADEDPTGGQFLLVGSAAPAPGATAHSGAGRMAGSECAR